VQPLVKIKDCVTRVNVHSPVDIC